MFNEIIEMDVTSLNFELLIFPLYGIFLLFLKSLNKRREREREKEVTKAQVRQQESRSKF